MQKTLQYYSQEDDNFRPRVKETNRFSQKSRSRAPLAWLKQHVSEIDIGGFSEKKGTPLHFNKNARVLEHFAALAKGERSFLPEQWNSIKIADHCSELRTCYFAGAGEGKKDSTLVMIDVDCKRSGSREGARRFLEFLRDNFFPGLYFENSTNGNGGHGYFVLQKFGRGSNIINKLLLNRLAPWLNKLAEEFDVEFVEVKGTLPVIEWAEKKFEVESYKAGTLAKVPRGLRDRFDELRNTTQVSVMDLQSLPCQEKGHSSESERTGIQIGSISGRYFDEETLGQLKEGGRFRAVAESLMSTHSMKTSGRAVVTVEDLSIALMVGEWLTNNICSNGAMPVKRWAELWKSLFEAGDVSRAWDHKRFAVIRDFLSSLKLLDWEDASYRIGWHQGDGTYVKGKAAKWRFSEELMEQLVEAGEQNVDVAGPEYKEWKKKEASSMETRVHTSPEMGDFPFQIVRRTDNQTY